MSEDTQPPVSEPAPGPAPAVPKEHFRPSIRRPGERLEPPSSVLVPLLSSETVKIAFRADGVTVDCINGHVDRIYRLAPGHIITVSDSLRSLIQRGAAAFAEDDKREPKNEDA